MKYFEVRPSATLDERQLWLRYPTGLTQVGTAVHRADGWQVDDRHLLGGSTGTDAPGITALRVASLDELYNALDKELGGAKFTEI